ncbi:O-antigen ligase family protein [Nocardioides ochotonae]|uniref:O-antigen ligase family protein n=1 Tax=Nocardioides ochotonae TaxID=2685869 RepID=UPI00140A56A0|nr:O-antigen ligase family protein [Nocardioides ochotonae]
MYVALLGDQPAAGVVGLVLAVLLFRDWRVWATLAAATLPFAAPLVVSAGGLGLALCDIFAVLALASYYSQGKHRDLPWRPLAAVAVPVAGAAVYFIVAGLQVVGVHPSIHTALTLVQRIELVVVWLVLGAVIYQGKALRPVLIVYVAGSLLLALAWYAAPGSTGVLGVQKNPAGSVIVVAILIALIMWKSTWRLVPVVILVGGLACTGSRGSMVSLAVAALVLLALGRSLKTSVIALAGMGAAAWAALAFLPAAMVDRILNRSSEGRYNADLRDVFVEDALTQWSHHQWTGVGIGEYQQYFSAIIRVPTTDPHNVYALALVEGGWPLLLGFLFLMGVTMVWLVRHFRVSPLIVLAICASAATFVHAYIDVYWVRGTPSLAWLLVGIAGGAIAASMSAELEPKPEHEPVQIGRPATPMRR